MTNGQVCLWEDGILMHKSMFKTIKLITLEAEKERIKIGKN